MANDGGLSLSTLAQVAQPVTNLERSINFYRDTLVGTFIAKFDPPGLAFSDCGGVRLMLDAVVGAMEPPGSPLYVRVDDLDVAVAELRSRGIEFDGDPQMINRDDAGDFGQSGVETWMAFFRDPDRNLLAVMSESAPNA